MSAYEPAHSASLGRWRRGALVALALSLASCAPAPSPTGSGSAAAGLPSPATSAVASGATASQGASPSAAATIPSSAPATGPSTPSPTPFAAGDPAHVHISLGTVVSGLASPVGVVSARDGSGRLFVVEQGGRIRVVRDGSLLARPFLDLSSLISCCGERGLLGLAFHPGYASDGRLYVYYTDASPEYAITIAEYRRSAADADVADPTSARIILRIPHAQYPNHDGGQLAFGPDGRLYAGVGDGGGGGNPLHTGQDLGSLLGKILRLDVDHPSGGLPYGTSGNPFAGRAGARPEIWAYGLRNPWRFSFDRGTGDLWIGDVGQSLWEEIDHASAGVGGQDYGWNIMEGFRCYSPASGCDQSGLTLPAAVYGHDVGCAVMGGFAYRGAAYPFMRGVYLFADYCSGRIWGLAAGVAGRQTPAELAVTGRPIVAFGEDEAGELYVADLGGTLARVVASPT